MEIRQLTGKDAESYYSLRLEALQNNPEAYAVSVEEEKNNSVEKYKQKFESANHSFTYGAFDGEELVGIVTLTKEKLTKLRHRANIFSLYVKEEKRGHSIGRKLLAAAIEKAKELEQIEQVHLSVVATNDAAKQLYRSLGFESYGVEKHALKYNDKYYDGEFMVLFL